MACATFGTEPLYVPLDPLAADMLSLLNDKERSDCTFLCEDGLWFYSVRAVLAARSAYFKSLFFGPMLTAEDVIRVPSGQSSGAFSCVLTWLHAGSLAIDCPLDDVLSAASFYQLPELEAAVVARMVVAMCTGNVIDLLKYAQRNSSAELKMNCLNFIEGNMEYLADFGEELRDTPELLQQVLMRATSMIVRTQRPARPNKRKRQVEQSERVSYTADTEEDLNATDTADTSGGAETDGAETDGAETDAEDGVL